MEVIREFDPWDSRMCTCPKKYSLNPYTGCGHRCIYCYSTYIPNFYEARRKKDLLKKVEKDLQNIPENSLISISNSSDPYLPIDKQFKDTRACLELLKERDMKVLIVTKGVHVERDLDLLSEMEAAVTVSLCTLDKDLWKKLEPNAPHPEKRLNVISSLSENQIPVGLRLDPVFPSLTEEDIPELVRKAKEAGAKHIVSSTFKAKKDSWKRFKLAFPKVAEELEDLYFERGEKIGNSHYLPEDKRKRIMLLVQNECDKNDLSFATCREGFAELKKGVSCDGSHLIDEVS